MLILRSVKLLQIAEADAFDVAADAAFGEGQCHPRFKMMNDLGRNGGMFRQEVIQSVRPSHHQCLEPSRAAAIILLQTAGIDEQSLTKIAVNGRLALGLCQQPQAVEVVALDAAEVILSLWLDRSGRS